MILYKSLLLNNIIFMKKYITLLFVFIFAITTFVSANYLSWYNLLWWSTIRITDMPDRWAYWAGYQVSNSSSNNYFVPTANTSEWNSFSSNRPSWVSICSIRNAWWSSWSGWSSCSRSCGWWTQYRTRSCNSPTASCGWSSCSGVSYQQQSCNTHSCHASSGSIRTGVVWCGPYCGYSVHEWDYILSYSRINSSTIRLTYTHTCRYPGTNGCSWWSRSMNIPATSSRSGNFNAVQWWWNHSWAYNNYCLTIYGEYPSVTRRCF